MLTNVENFANMPEHQESEMCVVIFMSHGNKDFIKSRDGRQVSVSSLLDKFTKTNCPFLIGKPKLFIIQACRYINLLHTRFIYSLYSTDLSCARGGRGGREEPTDSDSVFSASSERESNREWDDTIVCYSSVEGYVSFRNRVTGSWLISAMCKVRYNFFMLFKSVKLTFT